MLNEKDLEYLHEHFIDKFNFSKSDIELIEKNAVSKLLNKDELIYLKSDCYGYILVKSGSLRAYILSTTLKEITIFTLKNGEQCILCDQCFMSSFLTEINLQIESNTEIILIPPFIFKKLKDKYIDLLNFILKIVSKRFSTAVSLMEQAIFLPLIDRVRNFLTQNEQNGIVKVTHEALANNIGSAREAVSRILKEMEKSGEISQKRGIIKLLKNS